MKNPSTGKAISSPTEARDKSAPDPAHRPQTTAADGAGERAPRLPHEHDESSDSGTGEPSDLIQTARHDAESNKAPTDRSAETDAVYARTLRGKTPGAERDAK